VNENRGDNDSHLALPPIKPLPALSGVYTQMSDFKVTHCYSYCYSNVMLLNVICMTQCDMYDYSNMMRHDFTLHYQGHSAILRYDES